MRKAWLFVFVLSVIVPAMISLGTAGLTASSPAIESTPAPAPPKPDFSSMKYLLGAWSCTTKSSRRPTAATWTTTNSLDSTGYWMIGHDVGHKTPWFPFESTGIDKMTYDADGKRWIDIYTDDLGNYGVGTSPGVRGNTIVWSDALFTPSSDVKSESPQTETWISATKRTMTSRTTESSGAVRTYNTVCVKGG
jgi:hypothetical protein